MLTALKGYRKSLDLSPLPIPNEKIPLLTSLKSNAPLKVRNIRELVQQSFDRACIRLIEDNQQEEAALVVPHGYFR